MQHEGILLSRNDRQMRGSNPGSGRRIVRCFSGGISSLPVHCPAGIPVGSSGALPLWPSHSEQRFREEGHGFDWVSRISRWTLYLWLPPLSSTTPSVKPWL
jgi:hypothetical protein